MTKLAVVTLTRPGDKHKWYEAMQHSVASNLPDCAEHVIIECGSSDKLMECRWSALELAEYICFVDDDDLVLNNSLRLCLNALELNPDVAVAFTNEQHIDGEGKQLDSAWPEDRVVDYDHIWHSPQTVHHLTMLRTSSVDKERDRQTVRFLNIGDEWVMKAATALRSGAIHVPIPGYAWRRHTEQHSSSDEWKYRYGDRIHLLEAYLGAQQRDFGLVPRLQISS